MQTGGLRKGLKLKVDKKTVRKRYKCMAFLRKQGYNARGEESIVERRNPHPGRTQVSRFLDGTGILHHVRGDKLMEEFVSVEDVKRVFKAFCSKEISGCGSEEQECEDCTSTRNTSNF